jgi:uncharacterized protein (TIGR02300 family)
MSPRKGATKRAGSPKKSAKKPAGRAAAKKPAKKTAPKKTAPKKAAKAPARPARAAEAAPAARPEPKAAPAPPAAPKAKEKARPRARAGGRGGRRPEARPVGERKPGLGAKWSCFRCGAKFYDLNRPDPICPKCHADQRERPFESSSEGSGPAQRRPTMAPMSRFLDEEEPVASDYGEEEAAEIDLDALEEGGYLDTLEEEDE